LSRLRAGDTLYLLAGNYTLDAPVSIGTSGDKEISIRGHSLSEVTISGNIKLEDSHGVTFERINFGAQVAIVGGDGFAFSNCRFFGQPSGLDLVNANGVRVVHSVFDGFDVAAIHARATSGVFLQANLFNNHNAPALDLDTTAVLLYSDGNGFAD